LSTGLDGAGTELAPQEASRDRPGRGVAHVVLRTSGGLLVLGGALVLAWVIAVWQWQDPVTLLLNKRDQARLANAYEERVAHRVAPERANGESPAARYLREAVAYRGATAIGEPIGRLHVRRLGLDVVVVPARSPLAALLQVPRMFSGRIGTVPGVTMSSAVDIQVTSGQPVLYHVDGEPYTGAAVVAARPWPGALRVVVPVGARPS